MKIRDLIDILAGDSLSTAIEKSKENFKRISHNMGFVKNKVDDIEATLNDFESRAVDHQFFARRDRLTTDSYLFRGVSATNVDPYITPDRSIIMYLMVSSRKQDTWTLHIESNGSTLKKVPINNEKTRTIDLSSEEIHLGKGARLSMYCEGTDVDGPECLLVMKVETSS